MCPSLLGQAPRWDESGWPSSAGRGGKEAQV
jgi:hypothetical protein